MKKAILFYIFVLLLRFEAMAQSSSNLEMTVVRGSVTLKWINTYPFYLLLTTTNLSHPTYWDTKYVPSLSPLTVPIAYPQQFFRLTQVSLLFQSEIFYNTDLEISPDGDATIDGNVFANGNIWAAGNGNLTFDGTVQTGGIFHYTRGPDDPQTNGTGIVTFNGGQPVSGIGPLDYIAHANSITNSFQAMIALPPEDYRAPVPNGYYTFMGQSYSYNVVDLIVTNSASGTNLVVLYQNSNDVSLPLMQVPFDVTNIIGAATRTTNRYYSFVTNASFYDYRELKTVKAVQIDIGKFDTWLMHGGAIYNFQNIAGGESKGHMINSIYIFNNVPLTATSLPAVRVTDGATLPGGGLTIVTPQPLYVLGNYNASASDLGTTNVADTVPAALMCDAITILSPVWHDLYTSATPLVSRDAEDTTVNAAILTGIVPSITVNGVQHYSGGWENFLRLLEDWSGNTLTCNSSFVAGFPSQYATNDWQPPGNYYEIPTRNWNFDVNFSSLTSLPPLTPYIANFVTP